MSNFNPAFFVRDFHGTVLIDANLPFLGRLHALLGSFALPPFMTTLYGYHVKQIADALEGQDFDGEDAVALMVLTTCDERTKTLTVDLATLATLDAALNTAIEAGQERIKLPPFQLSISRKDAHEIVEKLDDVIDHDDEVMTAFVNRLEDKAQPRMQRAA